MPGAKFAMLGTVSPNPLLRYLLAREEYWATQQGLELVGEVDAQQDNPAAWATAGTTLSQKYPDLDVVVTYNDASAIAAINAIRSAGNSSIVVANSNGYQTTAPAAIEDGRMIASYAIPWDEKGRVMAIAAYNAWRGTDYPEIIAVQGQVVTKENVGEVTPIG